MIRKFLNRLEDPKRPLLGPNYWLLKKGGFVLPKNYFGKVAYVLLHLYAVFFVTSQYVELYIVKSDLDEVINNIKVSMLSIVCVIKSTTFVLWQKNWKEVLNFVTEADKNERDAKNETTSKIIDSYTKYCRKVTYFYWFLVYLTFVSVTHLPIVQYFSLRKEILNGTKPFPHIFSSWVPVDKYSFPGNWITVLSHVFITGYGCSAMCEYDTTVVVVMVFFGGQFDILREKCKVMLGRKGEAISDKQVFENVRQLHTTHVTLIKYIKLFNSLFSPVMFFYVVVNSLVLCTSAYQITSTNSTVQKLMVAEYLIFGITQLFMFCWHSDGVLVKSEKASYGLYAAEWWGASLPQRKAASLLMGQLRIIHRFSAGPFTNLSLYSFITILKGAYSYYTLLRE